MPSLFSRRKDSLSTPSPSQPALPADIQTSTSMTDPSTPPSAFGHYRKRSVDTAAGSGEGGRGIFGTRRGSGDFPDHGHGTGGLSSLKNKLTNASKSKLPFFHSHAPTVESTTSSDGSGRRASISTPENDPLKNVDRRRSLALSGMSSDGGGDENALRRGSMPVMSTSLLDSPEAVVGGSWTPLEPTRRLVPSSISISPTTVKVLPTSTSTTKHEEEVDSGYGGSMPGGTSDGSGSGGVETLSSDSVREGRVEMSPLGQNRIPLTSTSMTSPLSETTSSASTPTPTPTTRTPSSRPRPDIGKIDIPPPPSLTSRRQSTGVGMVVVQSTPAPRPIANLPTLGGGVGGGNWNDNGNGNGNRNGFTTATGSGMPTGEEMGRSRSGSNDDGSMAPTSQEVRKARNAMPVMLREPSHRPAPGSQSHHNHHGGHVGDDSISSSGSSSENGDSDSATESGTDEAASEEQHGMLPAGGRGQDDGILGGIARKPLVPPKARHGRQRSMGGTGVGAINEEEENETVDSPPLADRRQVPQPRLGALPDGSCSMSTATRPAEQPAAWGLPTPRTPPDDYPFAQSNSTSGWMQFGSMTPMARTPGNGLNSFSPRSTNVNQFFKVKELGRTPMATPANRQQHGYFDISTEQANAPVPTDEVEGAVGVGPAPEEADVPAAAPKVEEPAITLAQPEDITSAPIAPPAEVPISVASEAPFEADPVAEEGQVLPKQPVIVQTVDKPDEEQAPASSSLQESVPDAEGGPVIPDSIPEERETSVLPTEDGHNGSERGTSTMDSTPHPGSSTVDLGAAVMTIPAQPSSPPQVGSVQPDRPSRRPGLYSQISRSMVNLSSAHVSGTSTPDSRVHSSNAPSVLGIEISPTAGPSTSSGLRTSGMPDWARPPPTPGVGHTQNNYFNISPPSSRTESPRPNGMRRQESRIVGSPLKRTRSMDDVRVVNLPEYAPPEPGSRFPQPREEEGREGLPNYWCHVHIEGYLPRKMEFSAPGVQSRDRSWKRLYFVLHGTALSVYKHDVHKLPLKEPGAAPVPAVDPADAENLHVHLPGERRSSNASTAIATNTAARRLSSGTEPTVDRGRRGSSDMSIQPAPPPGGHRNSLTGQLPQNMQDAKDAQLFPTSQRPRAPSNAPSITPSTNSGGTIHAKEFATHLPFHAGNALVKQYSMQNAESGLAADYVKKKNVVRVRAEGEQFLLQTESAKEVVDWIEAFQAATNVSLELDVRPMPKIITLPRRRRRRRPGDPPAAGVPTTEDTPEGNAQAVAAAEAATSGGNVDAMERMLAEDQAAGV